MTEPGQEQHDGACHCGAVTFRVRLKGGLAAARRCNCSYCGMRGAVALTAMVTRLKYFQRHPVIAG